MDYKFVPFPGNGTVGGNARPGKHGEGRSRGKFGKFPNRYNQPARTQPRTQRNACGPSARGDVGQQSSQQVANSMSLGRPGDDGGWSWPWEQTKSPGPGAKARAKHHHRAVASEDITAELEFKGPRLSREKEARLGLLQMRRPTEKPPPTPWKNLNAAPALRRQNTIMPSKAELSSSPQRIADGSTPWEAVLKVEAKRQWLLTLARSAPPIDTVFRLSLLPRTVIPRLCKYKSLWAVLVVYAVTATLTRLGYEIDGPHPEETLEIRSSFVAFIIVFFVGYCYKRHEEQFDDVQCIMNSITTACKLARANFQDAGEVYRIWRYVNAMHCAAYCGLTAHLTEANFFMPLSMKHGLLGSKTVLKVESDAVRKIGIDANGVRASTMFEVRLTLASAVQRSTSAGAARQPAGIPKVPRSPRSTDWSFSYASQIWAMEVIRDECNRCKVPAPIQAMLQKEVSEIGHHIKKLFGYRYQVLPFIYTHLVSALSTFYLFVTAFLKGLHFVPGVPVVMGLVLPLIGLLIAILSTYGLVEVGSTILDPFGDEPEDFALTHFVEHAVGVSREAIEIQACSKRGAYAELYSPEEIRAAFVVLKSLIRRFRWRQIVEAARKSAVLRGAEADRLVVRGAEADLLVA